MKRYRLSSRARADLDATWDYVATAASQQVADNLIAAIEHSLDLLAENPEMGPGRADLAPFLRSFIAEQHVIYYLKTEKGIEVVRVLHSSRDQRATLGGFLAGSPLAGSRLQRRHKRSRRQKA